MAPVDAQSYWMSAHIANDQFLLYAFDGDPGELSEIVAGLRQRAAACADLRVRIDDDCAARYPRWADDGVAATQFVVHPPVSWPGCLDTVAGLAHLDPARHAWVLHVFPVIADPAGFDVGGPLARGTTPLAEPAGTVAVLQMSHALADGTRSAQLAAWLFGRDEPVAALPPRPRGSLVARSIAAARAHRQWEADVAAGTVPAAPAGRPLMPTNTTPTGPHRIRILRRDRRALAAGGTVTVAALAAIGAALGAHLCDRGTDVTRLGAEVPMADPGIRHAHNHFHNVGVNLHPDAGRSERAAAIAAELRDARRRSEHPALAAERRSLAAVPAPLLRWGVTHFDPTVRPAAVIGNTVVSSVNRGAADLRFGAAPVAFTAGFPALSPLMGLTHGVHGIGEVVTVSVHAAAPAMSDDDLDDYLARLDAALG